MNITGILLAAGKSTRMPGKNKLLLPYLGYTIVEEALYRMINANLQQIYVVLGYEANILKPLLADYESERVKIIINASYENGRTSSIACGLRHCDKTVTAALFMVADKPTIKTDLINRVIERFKTERPVIAAVSIPDGRGHPIIFNRSLFDELIKLQGDLTGADLIEKHTDEIGWIEDSEPQLNINSPADYQRLLARTELSQ